MKLNHLELSSQSPSPNCSLSLGLQASPINLCKYICKPVGLHMISQGDSQKLILFVQGSINSRTLVPFVSTWMHGSSSA